MIPKGGRQYAHNWLEARATTALGKINWNSGKVQE